MPPSILSTEPLYVMCFEPYFGVDGATVDVYPKVEMIRGCDTRHSHLADYLPGYYGISDSDFLGACNHVGIDGFNST